MKGPSDENTRVRLSPFMSWLIGELDSTFKICDRWENPSSLDMQEVKMYSGIIKDILYAFTLLGTTCSSLLVSRHVSDPLYIIPVPILGIALLYQISKWEIKEASNER